MFAHFAEMFNMTEEEVMTFADALRAEIVAYMDECGVRDETYVEEDVNRILTALMDLRKGPFGHKGPKGPFTVANASTLVQVHGSVYQDYTNGDEEWDCSCAMPEMCQGECETSEEFRAWTAKEIAEGRTHTKPITAFKMHKDENRASILDGPFMAEEAPDIVRLLGNAYTDYSQDEEWDCCSCPAPEKCRDECGTSEEFREWTAKETAAGHTYKFPITAFKKHMSTKHGFAWKKGEPCGCGCNKMECGMSARNYVKYMEGC